ncbi:MAG: molecular chaperone TorD family protein [Alphaproteobacteria bacterium]|nr:molecular chaperone TorD family protein [Alphaproteobacteria bacterium]MCK5623354.1 molecular chaperone TorD family protein [Alphaproteobacteria bacterium]
MSDVPKGGHSESETIGEDRQRAQLYRLLAGLLARIPDREALGRVAGVAGDESELGQALTALGQTAAAADPARVDDEYHDLFIGMGRGELMPYGSYYLTGFVYEKPLARLRVDMDRLGIARADDIKEPEDHIAALCEMMAGLIEGAFGEPADIVSQRAFFDAHIGPWAGQFFADLETAKATDFYAPVGAIGRIFMEIESTAFEMAA